MSVELCVWGGWSAANRETGMYPVEVGALKKDEMEDGTPCP